jgi:hypothetical protein
MTICSSCGEEIETATGRCVRCRTGLAGSSRQPEAISREAAGPVPADPADAAAAEAGAAADHQDEETEKLPGLIRPNRLNLPLRLLMWLAITQIVLVAILMALQKVRQPQVNSSVLDPAGGTFAVPLAIFVFMTVSVAAGYWFGLAGALRVRTSVGIPVAALATWTLADYPITILKAGSTGAGQPSDAGLLWAQLGVLAVFWVWFARVALARRRAQATGPAVRTDPDGQPWQSRVVLGAGACVLAYYALEFAIWVQYLRAGQAVAGTGFLLNGLGVQSVLLPTFLILVLLLGSTDLLEWGEITVRRVIGAARRAWPPWLLMIVTLLVAIAILANVIRLDGGDVLLELAVIGTPAVLIAVLVWLVPGYGKWSAEIRSRAEITGAVVIFIYSTILLSVTSFVLEELGWPSRFDTRFYSLVSTPIALAALTAGVFILARGALGHEQRGRGLFLVIAAVALITAGLPGFLLAARLPAVLPVRHFSLLSGLLFVAAAATIIGIIVLALLGRLSMAVGLLANALGLLVGLQLVRWLLDLLQAIAALSADSDYLLAGLFFLTVLWGLASSGDSLTGTKANSAKYPRDGRILLTVSYTLISSATLLYLGALHGPVRAPAPPSYLTGDPFTPVGLAVLGSALVIVAFVIRLTQPPPQGSNPEELAERSRAHVRVPSARAVQFGIVGLGAALTAASLVVAATGGFPELARASATQPGRSYTARVPGPDCGTGGAAWSAAPGQPFSTRCGRNGLLMAVAPRGTGSVEFRPHGGFTSPNYRVSVTVTFGTGFNGCAGIYTRVSTAGRYDSYVCGGGSAGIFAFYPHHAARLAAGSARPAPSYTIVTVSDGADQSLFVNGKKIATVVSKAFRVTDYVGLAIFALPGQAGSATFSHFVFRTLPVSPRT